MIHLQQLLASDLSKAETETLVEGVQDAELAFDTAQEWSGRFVAELRRRGDMSWPALEKLTGVPKGTLIRRAQPYL